MREIKFRAWDKQTRDMLEFFAPSMDFYNKRLNRYRYFFDRHIIRMQFTGLHDRNGREIYGGDLLRHPNGTIAEIRYLNDLAAFVAIYKQNGNTEVDYLDKEIVNKCKVIGNIYENPELLEAIK